MAAAKTTTTFEYHISFAHMKDRLGLDGEELVSVELWSGLSPADEREGVSHENDVWHIVTRRVVEEEQDGG